MSESLEMYLITIAQFGESSEKEVVPLSLISKAMDVLPVSANQMIKKIAELGLAVYIPYKGVQLTPAGRRKAMQILRKRRIWQVLLVEELGMPPEDADAFSCKLEHITPDDVIERLAEHLGHPTVSPLGKPIPHLQPSTSALPTMRLSILGAGQSGVVMRIDAEPATRSFLAGRGIRPGANVVVLAKTEDGSLLVESDRHQTTIAGAIADKVAIQDMQPTEQAASKYFQKEKEVIPTKQIPLSELPAGKEGVIVKINSRGTLRRRLLDMGLVSGEIISVERVAPLGDPVEFTVKEYHLSLRKKEAEQVIVEVEDER